jgi:hypothetical protein
MSKMVAKPFAPIFVVGTPRSGTTLTASILGRHSRIFMPGETHFFDDIYSRRAELGDARDPAARVRIIERLRTLYERYYEPADQKRVERLFADPQVLNQMRASGETYRGILSLFMQLQMESFCKERWGNNAPRDIFNIEDILDFYPDAKILVCVRDVRDFLISYRDKWKVTRSEDVERLKDLYHPVVTSLLWKSSMKRIPVIAARVPAENFMIIRYEELVQKPESVVRDICRVVGEAFEPGMLDVDSNNSSAERRGAGIFATSIGRWRQGLTAEDVCIAQWLACAEIVRYGYRIEATEARLLGLCKAVCTFPFALWRALGSNKVVRGPLIPYIARRAASLLRP